MSQPWADGTPTLPCKVPGACYFETTEVIFRTLSILSGDRKHVGKALRLEIMAGDVGKHIESAIRTWLGSRWVRDGLCLGLYQGAGTL